MTNKQNTGFDDYCKENFNLREVMAPVMPKRKPPRGKPPKDKQK